MMDYQGRDSGYTDREVCNLIAGPLAVDPNDLLGGVIIGIKSDGGIQMSANLALPLLMEVLSEAGMRALYAGAAAMSGVPEHEHDAEGNCIWPEGYTPPAPPERLTAGEAKSANPLAGATVDDLLAELGHGDDKE